MKNLTQLIVVLTPVFLAYMTYRLRQQDRTRDAARAEIAAELARVKQMFEVVDDQLTTLNQGTVGSFAADDETRRIEALPFASRTKVEQHHIDEAEPKGPPQGPKKKKK